MRLFRAAPRCDRSALLERAEAFRAQGKIGKAIREYERILAADPLDINAHARIAPLYILTGRRDKARASLPQLVAWYESRGFLDKAVATLRLALKLDRRDLDARLHLVDLYLQKELPQNALALLVAARRLFRGRRFLEQALAVEERILRVAPDDFRAQVETVRLLGKAGREREGRERLWRMESHWARKGNAQNWRRTRWLLSRHAPSAGTLWGCFVSLFVRPAPYGPRMRGRSAT
ncbi:MAG: tetratricopeptide repeat protein [Gemmatimonadota bacterium]